jgi:hypothetical protein
MRALTRTETIHRLLTDIFEASEMIRGELSDQAESLKREAHKVIDEGWEKKYRRPPLTLACHYKSNVFGPILVWVTYSISKRTLSDGSQTRFTQEIVGRKRHSYPDRTFAAFPPDTRAELIRIEKEASRIRISTAYWAKMIKAAQAMLEAEND